MQSSLIFRARYFEVPSFGESHKCLGTKCGGPNRLFLRKKLGVGSSLSTVWHYAGGGVCGKIVSQPFLPISMWVFAQCVGVT